jgi:hypothetical protein
MKRATRSSARDADEGDGTSSELSNTSEDSPVSPPIGNEVASDLDPTAGVVEGITVDWTIDAAVPGGNPALHVPTSNPMVQGIAEEDNNSPTVHSGGEQQVEAEVQEKIVVLGSTVNDDTMGSSAEVQSAVGTTPPRSAVLEAREWAQSISTLVYEVDSDYYVYRLNRMWVQEHPPAPVEVVDGDRWGTFQGNYFKRIEVPDLLQRQRFVPHPENDASSEAVIDGATSLMFFASGSSIGRSHTGDELERVLESWKLPRNRSMC